MVYIGKHTNILIGKESTYGTGVATTKDIGLVQDSTINGSNSLRRHHAVANRNAVEIVAGKIVSTGSLEVLFQNGRLLEYALGSVSHQLSSSDTTHTFAEANDIPSFTMTETFSAGATDDASRYTGCKLNTLTIALAVDGQVTLRGDWIGQNLITTASTVGAVTSTLVTLPDFYGSLKTGTNAAEATIGNLQKFEVTINNHLEPLHGVGSRQLTNLLAHERTYEFTFTMAFANQTEMDIFLGGEEFQPTSTPAAKSLIFNVTNGTTLGSGRREINVDFTEFQYEAVRSPKSYRGYILQDFTGWAKAITGSGTYTVDNIIEASW